MERTGRIVTAAALLFCVAIGTFATSGHLFIQELGVGTAVAVALDATIIRALLVPSLMALLGDWNWWAPGPLRRLHLRLTSSGRRRRPRPGAGTAQPGSGSQRDQVGSHYCAPSPSSSAAISAPRARISARLGRAVNDEPSSHAPVEQLVVLAHELAAPRAGIQMSSSRS